MNVSDFIVENEFKFFRFIDGAQYDLYQDTHWLRFYKKFTSVKYGLCHIKRCPNLAFFGAHVEVFSHDLSKRRIGIMPICKEHNHIDDTVGKKDVYINEVIGFKKIKLLTKGSKILVFSRERQRLINYAEIMYTLGVELKTFEGKYYSFYSPNFQIFDLSKRISISKWFNFNYELYKYLYE